MNKMANPSLDLKKVRILNVLLINFMVYFVLILPYFMNYIETFRFDYAVYTIPIYLIFIGGTGIITNVFIGKILKVIFDRQKNLRRNGLTCIFLISSAISIVIFLLYTENRIYWASDSPIMAIYLLIFFILEYFLLLIFLNSGVKISSFSKLPLIIGTFFTLASYIIMIFVPSFTYISLIAFYLGSTIYVNYPKLLPSEYEPSEKISEKNEKTYNLYIKRWKIKYLSALIKYFTFFLSSFLIAINTLRIFFDVNIWSFHFLILSASFFIMIFLLHNYDIKNKIKHVDSLILLVILTSLIEIILMLIFSEPMTFRPFSVVLIFNIVHGISIAMFVYYLISMIQYLTPSSKDGKALKDTFFHVYALFWLIATLVVYLGFGYLLNEVEWANPSYILLIIALGLFLFQLLLSKILRSREH